MAYHENAVRVVCTVLSATPATRYPTEISVIVSQSWLNQPLMSQPSRSAAAPMTTIRSPPISRRLQRGRLSCTSSVAVAAWLTNSFSGDLV
jgi:hypothetical protein